MKRFAALLLMLNTFSLLSQDSLKLNQNLEEVIVSFSQDQRVLYAKRDHYILDMQEDVDGILLLIKKRDEYFVEKIEWSGNRLFTKQIPFKATTLKQDCLTNKYLVGKDRYQRFHIDHNTLSFDENFDKVTFEMEIQHCVAASYSKLMFQGFLHFNQSIYLSKYDFENDSLSDVLLYIDSLTLKTNREELFIIRSEGYTNHARMGDIWSDELAILIEKQEREMFFSTISTNKPYAPIFSHQDDHYFFNFLNDSIYWFNEYFELIGQFSIPIKKSTQLENSIILDHSNGLFYYANLQNSSLELFSIRDKQVLKAIPSEGVRAATKFIYNNRLYFIGKSSLSESFNKIFIQNL